MTKKNDSVSVSVSENPPVERPRKRFASLAFAAALALLSMTSTSSLATPAVGSEAPAFTLNTQEGKPLALNDLRGKWVVLYFYPKDFSSGCTLEAHNFERDLKQYEAKNAVILGVSTQDEKSHKEFCVKEKLSFRLLADVDGKVSKTYASDANLLVTTLSKRHTFLIDPEGRIARAYLDVDPRTHSAQVLSDLTALQQPKTPQPTTQPTAPTTQPTAPTPK